MIAATRLPTEGIKLKAKELGFYLAGVCPAQPAPHLKEYERWLAKGYHGTMDYLQRHTELKQHPNQLLEGCQSIIAVALNYNQPNPPVEGQPRIARYALGRDYHKVLRAKLKTLAAHLQQQHPEAQFRPCVDSAPIFERDFANLAGLGWFGKNTMLINSERGSWFFLGLLLTTLDLQPDTPSVGSCGTCQKCIQACPTGAIVFEEDRWQIKASHCISYLTIEHPGEIPGHLNTSGWTFGCDTCQEVCPFNHERPNQPLRAQPTQEPDFLKKKDWPTLTQLAQITEETWNPLTQSSPIRRTGLPGLRRNANLNLQSGLLSLGGEG